MGLGAALFPYVFGIHGKAVWSIIQLISVLYGLTIVNTTIRDVTAGVSTQVELSRDETIEKILNDPALTPEQRAILVEAYLEKMGGDSEFVAVVNKLMIVAVVIAVAYVAVTYTKGK